MAKKQSYEDMKCELESIIDNMENHELTLEECLKNYEKGIKIYKKLYALLNGVQGKVDILTKDIEENFVEKEE